MEFVINGNLSAAEKILSLSSELVEYLCSPGESVKDSSGRYFKNPTPLKLALWSWKHDMQNMLLKYMSPTEALYQLKGLEEYGIKYHIKIKDDIKTITESYYDFNIIDALQNFYNYYKSTARVFTKDDARIDYKIVQMNDKKNWCEIVGQAQFYAPSSVVELYCNNFKFHRITNEWMGEEWRTRPLEQSDFNNYLKTQSSSKFYGIKNTIFNDNDLGRNFAIIRGECYQSTSVAKPEDLNGLDIGYWDNAVEIDLNAVRLFHCFCMQKLEKLKHHLEIKVSNKKNIPL